MKKGFYSAAKVKTPPPLPAVETKVVVESARRGWRDRYKRHEKPLLFVAGALLAAVLVALHGAFTPAPHEITQDDIDQAVARTLETKPVPSPAVKAYQAVRSSIVRVRALSSAGDPLELDEYGGAIATPSATGSGVVIIDRGVILTSLHVVAGAARVRVEFEDGLVADAAILSQQPENDLAILQANKIPDDLRAATLRSAKHLVEGEHVTAIGFPFGIGPSVSHGIISGLRREYRSPDGERNLSNLIQFDAAANPGSSGGPLVNAAGEVVGIVTAILSTAEKGGSFSGIGFAVPIETAAAAAGLPPF
ncbi:MAG: trypsin-like peptidase domain-containing protein [Betaproteobacteria bacterium]|nr:trypsin-like peptidase domain-containing protein [Betaproteobacteria bacterium]MBV9360646.1 trypsin-like peptidase domain-containing protein [Betaproteobacteria bacterium]